jgi:hypothetical protein
MDSNQDNGDQEVDQEEDQEENIDYEEQARLHMNEYIIAALIGIPSINIEQNNINNTIFNDNILINQNESQNISEKKDEKDEKEESLTGKVHYMTTMEDELSYPIKKPHIMIFNQSFVKRKITLYNYLKLKSGETFRFQDDDGKEILLSPTMEPNMFIRKIISNMPWSIKNRLIYLAKFMNEELNEVIEIDEIETDIYIESSQQLNKKTIFSNLKEQVYNAFLREIRLRSVFRRVLQRWRINRIDKKTEKEVDPITLTYPEKEVNIYDIDLKKKYVFDAKSLSSLIESQLLYSEGGFAIPMYPRNPLTNIEFTYNQLISIYIQLKSYGELRWGFTTLRQYNFSKSRWQLYHNSALTMNGIRSSLINLDSRDARELLEDFILLKMDELHIFSPIYITNAYKLAIQQVPHHWYLEEFKAIAFIHYEADHFGQNRLRYINERCSHLFKKQSQFIQELASIHNIQIFPLRG